MTRRSGKATVRLFSWRGRLIQVRYELAPFGLEDTAHLAIRCLDPANGALPITETGFRSAYIHADEDELPGGRPVGYVRRWLDEAARDRRWIAAEDTARQLTLL